MKRFVFVGLLCAALSLSAFSQSRKLNLESTGSKNQPAASQKGGSQSAADMPRIELEKNQICNVYALAYSPDGKHLVAGYNNNLVRIWDITTGEMVRTLKGHSGVVWSVAYSPDGKTIISGSADRTVKCWDAETGNLIRTLPSKKGDKGHDSIVSYVTFNPNGTYIASGSSDKSVKFWDASTGMLLQTLANTHSKTIAAISYSNSGRYVATASWDKTAKIYHAMGGIERNILTGHTEAVYAVQFSPDEKYIATGSADRTVRIYNAETGDFVRAITGITGEVWTLSYSPDGKLIAVGNADGSVCLFDSVTGKREKSLGGHQKEVRSCAFDASGKHLFTGDSEGIIKMWNVETGDLIVTMLQVTDGNWVTWTPVGFLTGSDGALAKLSYTAGGKKYSLEEIKKTVFRPDIVAEQMQGKDSLIGKEASFEALVARESAPEIQFVVSNADGSRRADSKNRDVSVKIRVTDTGSGIGKVYVKLNGRAFFAAEGESSVRGQAHDFSLGTPLSLRYGKNTISVSVFDKTNTREHQSTQQELEWEGATQKSRLFVLAAGVDSYSDKNVANLSGCVNDAKALAETSRQYAGDLYMNVFERVMANEEVSGANLLNSIREFGQSVEPDDVFILYLAGHGITHTDGEYYFIPQDFKSAGKDPVMEHGVSKWSLISALSTVRAENITVILDTCNSASFSTQNKVSEEDLLRMSKRSIIERMGALSGFDLITACTSAQVAVDNFKGHGVFTYCLLDGIKGAADLDQNGQVTSAELATYVIKEVPVQSNKQFGYKQEPQRSQPKFDFPMFGRLNPLDGQSLKDALEIAKLVREKGLNLETATAQVAVSGGGKSAESKKPEAKKEAEKQAKKPANPASTASLGVVYDGENAVIFNLDELPGGGKLSDEIHIYNATHLSGMSVSVEGYIEKKGTWQMLGTVKLKGPSSDEEIEKTLKKKYSKFAVKPSVSEPVRVSAKIDDEYLVIHLLSEETIDSNAEVLDAATVPGKFKDNVRFISQISDTNACFDLYARKSGAEPWQKVGCALLKKREDTDFVKSALVEPVSSYSQFTVLAHNGKSYTYKLSKSSNDLYITVQP